jgi:hypothetical protein
MTKKEKRVSGGDFITEQKLYEERKWANPEDADLIDEEIESLHYDEKLEFNPVGFIIQGISGSASDEKNPEWLEHENLEKSTEQWQREFNETLDKYKDTETIQ